MQSTHFMCSRMSDRGNSGGEGSGGATRSRRFRLLRGGGLALWLLGCAAACATGGPTLTPDPPALDLASPGELVPPIEAPLPYPFQPPELVQRIRVIEAQIALLKEIPAGPDAAGIRRALVLLGSALTELPVPSPAADSAAAMMASEVGDEARSANEHDLQMRIKRALQYAAGGLVVTAQGPYERFPVILDAARRFQKTAERIDPSEPSTRREQVAAALDAAVLVLRAIADPT
jgi:hypothetical protein